MYKVAWRNLLIDKEGEGQPVFETQEQAQKWVDSSNEKSKESEPVFETQGAARKWVDSSNGEFKGEVTHWIVKVD